MEGQRTFEKEQNFRSNPERSFLNPNHALADQHTAHRIGFGGTA